MEQNVVVTLIISKHLKQEWAILIKPGARRPKAGTRLVS